MSLQVNLRSVCRRNYYPSLPNQVWNRICGSKFSDKTDSPEKPDDDRLIEEKPWSGYVYDEGIQFFRSKWRVPFVERKSFFRSSLAAFSSKKFKANITKLNPQHFQYFDFKKWWQQEKREKLVYDQAFIEERLMVLGCDLAAAHFIVYRGGAVKFVGHNRWIRDDKKNSEYDVELPNQYNPDYAVEAIDSSQTKIVYEGLKNFENLSSLKWLSFANCPYFDDWCLDRVSGEHRNNLEFLDISFTQVTQRGLYALYRFNKLKTLAVDEYKSDPLFFQTCLELQKELKGLNIQLVTSESPAKEQNRIEASSSISHT